MSESQCLTGSIPKWSGNIIAKYIKVMHDTPMNELSLSSLVISAYLY